MPLAARAVLAWLGLLVLMFVNGALRVLVLQPRLGEDTARPVASLTGVAEDYDVRRGRLWILILVGALLGPWACARVRADQRRAR